MPTPTLTCSVTVAVELLVVAAATALHAAPITWDAPTHTTGKADLIEGKVIVAFTVGTASPVVTGGGACGTSP